MEKSKQVGNIFKPYVLLYSSLTAHFCNIYSLLHAICSYMCYTALTSVMALISYLNPLQGQESLAQLLECHQQMALISQPPWGYHSLREPCASPEAILSSPSTTFKDWLKQVLKVQASLPIPDNSKGQAIFILP